MLRASTLLAVMCLVFAAKPQCKLIVELAKNMLAGGWIKVVVDWYVLL